MRYGILDFFFFKYNRMFVVFFLVRGRTSAQAGWKKHVYTGEKIYAHAEKRYQPEHETWTDGHGHMGESGMP